jgi:hypothetical protein
LSVPGTATGHTYQVSDFQRQYRSIVSEARAKGALIRDKDGLSLTLAPTETIERAHALVGYIPGLVQLEHLVRQPRSSRHVSAFGSFAWAAVLDEDDLVTFVHEFADALLVASSGGPLRAVTELLYDWRVTAEMMGDPDLVAELTEDADEPLHDVEL